jgi:hypothetical protein
MLSKSKLQAAIVSLLVENRCTKELSLVVLTEALVRAVLDAAPNKKISAVDRRRAHTALSYWFESTHEQDVSNQWHRDKMERLLKLK